MNRAQGSLMSDFESDAGRAPLFLALSCVGFLSSPALADPVADPSAAVQSDVERGERPEIVVKGSRQQQPRLESPKATSNLLDTPQTITVLSSEQIKKQNLLTL